MKNRKKSIPLIVSQEAIKDFGALNAAQRLEWLDEMRSFLSRSLSAKAQRAWNPAWQGQR